MKRRNFINLALFLPVLNSLKTAFTDDELLRFNQADLEPLLKLISPANKATATLMMKNLLFDVQYLLRKGKDLKDPAVLKKLAIEADGQFYKENKLSAASFRYQPLTVPALKEFREKTSAKPELFDAMMKTLTSTLNELKESKAALTHLLTAKITSNEAISEAQKAQVKKADEVQECAKNWSIVACIVALIIVIVIAIVVSVFSFGATGAGITVSILSALAATFNTGISTIVLTPGNLLLNKTNISLATAKVDFSKVGLDKLLKSSISSVAIASAISTFSKTTYPANPMAGSIVVNLFAIIQKIPGIETV